MIIINEDFTYDTDAYNWNLYHWADNTGKGKVKNKRTFKKSYHNTLAKMLAAVLDKSLKEGGSIENVHELIESLTAALLALNLNPKLEQSNDKED